MLNFGDEFLGIACTLEAETSVVNFTQYKLFIGDDKKNTISGVTFSFKIIYKDDMYKCFIMYALQKTDVNFDNSK